MAKKALILHGTDASPDVNWFPWLKLTLEAKGYEVWVPNLPGNNTPNKKVYNDFLHGCGWDFTDNIIIGHSSGAVSVLNLLEDERTPSVNNAVMVGAWAKVKDTVLNPEVFKDLFPDDGFKFDEIKSKAKKIAFLHGSDDPYCPLKQAKWLARQLNAPIKIVPNGHHLGSRYHELPEILDLLKLDR